MRQQLTWYVLLRTDFQDFLTTNAQLGFGTIERARHRRAIEHVGRDCSGATTRCLDARLDRSKAIAAACDQRDRGPCIRQHLGEAHPEPARGAGDQRDFSLETEQLGRAHLRSRLDRRCERYCPKFIIRQSVRRQRVQ